MSVLRRCYRWFHDLLHRPVQVFWLCLAIAVAGLVLDGTAFRLWSLKRDYRVLSQKISEAKTRSKQLEFKIQKSQELDFIERAARDRFDLVKDGDLVFIFADENAEGSEVSEKTIGI